MNKTELRRIIKNYEAMTQPEPCRPLTWAELMKIRKDTPLYIECCDGRRHWVIYYGDWKRRLPTKNMGNATKYFYNRAYRYWPRVPTRRERKAAKWEA